MDKIFYKKIVVTIEKLSFTFKGEEDNEDIFASLEITTVVPYSKGTPISDIYKRALIIALSNMTQTGSVKDILYAEISYANIKFEEET